MNPQRNHVLVGAMGLVIAVLVWALVYYARDEFGAEPDEREEHIETASTAGVEEGRPVVRVTAQSQAASGMVMQALKAGRSEAAAEAYGMVMNLQPLAELRGRYLTAVADARAVKVSAAAAEQEYQRMELLFRDDRNVSEQAVKLAEGRYRAEAARQLAAERNAESIRDAIRSGWGETVGGWVTNPDSRVMQQLLQQSAFLVQLVLPYDLPRRVLQGKVAVAPVSARENARAARFVADSPQVDAALPGETCFYLVEGGGLRAGMRVIARLPLGAGAVSGVIVPAAAIVWHAGKAWVYVKGEDGETFARYEAFTTQELDGGWFNTGLEPGAEVVVSGAQLLLSEELKYQIRNENED